jgi:hypothetical protein
MTNKEQTNGSSVPYENVPTLMEKATVALLELQVIQRASPLD